MEMVNMSKKQLHRDKKCQLKVTHVSSMNHEETQTPQGRLQLALKQHHTKVQQNSCPYILQWHKSKLKVKTNNTYRGQKFLTWDRCKKCHWVIVLRNDHNPPPFKLGHF